ncbi:ABC transporter permease [Nocardiopsis algeriensis]|uniref:ABC transporter permease n=1 Tax=Nocardiopsis algeriensis TaxID=1478215 RepID=UPI003B42CF1B
MLRSFTAGIVLAFAGSRANVARTILSCAGIVVGVGSLILVVTGSDFGERFAIAYSETNAGRAATFEISVMEEVSDQEALEEDIRRAGAQEVSLFQTPSASVLLRSGGTVIDTADFRGVDASLGEIRRFTMAEGRWFTEADLESRVPVLVVNEDLANAMGDRERVQIGTDRWTDVRIVGVLESSGTDFTWQSAYLLRSPASEDLLFGPPPPGQADPYGDYMPSGGVTYLARIDPGDPAAQDPTGTMFHERLTSTAWRWGVRSSDSVWGYRIDGADVIEDAVTYLSWGLAGIAAITLTTGLLGVLNVGLVTVRERRRELATYRALGASRFTLFVVVVMESVVVSLVAGVIALLACWALVTAAAAVLESFVSLPTGVALAIPPSGVLVGLGSAAAVGLLAGIVPAMRALRSSVVAGLRE